MGFPDGQTLPVPTSVDEVKQLNQSLGACLNRFDVPYMLGEMIPNPHLHPNSALLNAWQRGCTLSNTITKGEGVVLLVFHGTYCDWNINNICQNGFDPSRRHSQGLGSGEYFHATCAEALNYSAGTHTVIATLVLVSPFLRLRSNNTIAIVNNPSDPTITFSLPIFTIHYSPDFSCLNNLSSDSCIDPLPTLESTDPLLSLSITTCKAEEADSAEESLLKETFNVRTLVQIYPQSA